MTVRPEREYVRGVLNKILSIDGGGIRGIIPAMVLAFIEHETGKPISEQFDLIAGTSTGGIIALALTMPGDGGPRWKASDLVALYEHEGPAIFPQSFVRKLRTGFGAFDERYPSSPIESVLHRYFGDTPLSAALTPVLISSYELVTRAPFFFKSTRARDPRYQPSYDFRMREVARATSAAPTYFEPFHLRKIGPEADDPDTHYTLVDGGVFANNPAMCAWAEPRDNASRATTRVLSVGTGELTRPLPYEKVKDWGLLRWATPILNVVMDGVSDATDYQLRELLEARYLRATVDLTVGNDDLDDATPANIHKLQERGQMVIDRHGAEILNFL